MKLKLTITMVFVVAGCVCWLSTISDDQHKEPPPGWTIVTNGEGEYAPRFPSGLSVIDQEHGMSYQRAVNLAWEQYEYEQARDRRAAAWKEMIPNQNHP